ncbi:MAG: alpha/beta fold hydrolase [Labilibaculum sp.]|nr:alpha/beta fold hydrolase [Labilibaculum sp.]MBI9059930.1 alpha/beta fold hydrolase [Labilibaculum sp.]
MKKFFFRGLKIISLLVIIGLALFYFNQEKLIFHPHQLEKEYQFTFDRSFEEVNIKTKDDKMLNGILLATDNSKGLVFYLHGNAGSLKNCGDVAQTYGKLNYDVFMLDYRGFGKSEGEITSQQEMFSDVQLAYDHLLKRYSEEQIIVLGYSIGTGPASYLAANNNPNLLVLQAPYFNLSDMMNHYYPYLPTILLKYKFPNDEFITKCKMPVVIFHGTDDEVIPYASSQMLYEICKPEDQFITLKEVGHANINSNPQFKSELARILN